MTEPIIVTDELRKAVYEDDCNRLGHIYRLETAINVDKHADHSSGVVQTVRGMQDDILPHISCARCPKVWLVDEEASDGYDAAEEKVIRRIKPSDPLAQRIKDRRAQREQRLADAQKLTEKLRQEKAAREAEEAARIAEAERFRANRKGGVNADSAATDGE